MVRLAKLSLPGRHPRTFLTDDCGATAIEYALIAAFLSVSIAVIVPMVGVSVSDLFVAVAALF